MAESVLNRYRNGIGRSNRIRRHRKCVPKPSLPRGPTSHVSRRLGIHSSHMHCIDTIGFSGSVKSNIGHLEGGSGIAGLIKAILVLEKGVIPPNANFERINSRIDAQYLNIRVSAPSPKNDQLDKLACRYRPRWFPGQAVDCAGPRLIPLVLAVLTRMLCWRMPVTTPA